jgi:hypothetical protein
VKVVQVFKYSIKCICGEQENMEHINQSELLSNDKSNSEYDRLIMEAYTNKLKFLENLKIINKSRNPLPCDPTWDLLYSVENSIG